MSESVVRLSQKALGDVGSGATVTRRLCAAALIFGNQLPSDFRHVGGNIAGLGDEIECSHGQRLQSYRCPLGAVRTHHDHRQRVAQHDLFQHVQTAHAGHVEIKSDNLRLHLFDLFQTEVAIHGSAYDLNRAVGLKDLWNQLAHERGVVHH